MSDATNPVDLVLAHLDGVRPTGSGWTALCPAHDDNNASLSIGQGDDGRVLLKCFAGCAPEAVVEAIGLEMAQLFARPGSTGNLEGAGIPSSSGATAQHLRHDTGCTLTAYAEAKRLPVSFLQSLGLRDVKDSGITAIRMPYLDATGQEMAVRFRLALSKANGMDNRFRWRKGSKPFLYGLWRLKDALADGYVVLVEGESDAQTLWLHEIPALGVPGATNWNERRDARHLEGVRTIYAVIEPDRGGEAVKSWLAKSSIRDRVQLVRLGNHKDVSELYLSDTSNFLQHWDEALKATVSWSELAADEKRQRHVAAWRMCEQLAKEPTILDLFASVLSRAGVVGEGRLAKLLYLVMTSRLLDSPVSAAVKGVSSAGKSYVMDKVLDFFPDSAYYEFTSMSERALVYFEEPLQHRFLVLYEAAGLNSDFANYAIRSLLSEDRLRYLTVEKTGQGLNPRLINHDGPTGLLLTTTAIKLHPENETRLLSITVNDTPEQTAAILDSLAREDKESPDLAPWHALQEWLEDAEHRVTVPFSEALARLIPPVAVRLRRDFEQVLTFVRTHAMLHQAGRQRDGVGRIVALLEDYAAVRELLADLLAEGVGHGVSGALRETVTVVAKLRETNSRVTVMDVAHALRVDKATASRRVSAATESGFLRNRSNLPGRPHDLAVGGPLPEEMEVLPTPGALQAAWEECCSVAPSA